MKKRLTYYFDFLSPYSYLSWHLSKSIRASHEIQYKPVVMAKLFEHFEIKGPALILPKRIFLLKQCFRVAHKNNIPFKTPAVHPFNPLYVLRLATLACGGAEQEKIIDALWEAIWVKKIKGDDPDALSNFLDTKGFSGKELLEKISDRECKEEVKKNTETAIEKGVFGVPTIQVDQESFWGQDSLVDLKNYLDGNDLFNGKKLEDLL